MVLCKIICDESTYYIIPASSPLSLLEKYNMSICQKKQLKLIICLLSIFWQVTGNCKISENRCKKDNSNEKLIEIKSEGVYKEVTCGILYNNLI